MNFFTQTEQAAFIVALVANVAMLILVLRYAEKNLSRIMFTFFILAQVFWITMNSFAFLPDNPNFLILARLTMFSATFHAFFFLLFTYSFLEKKKPISLWLVIPSTIGLLVTATLTLTPLVFSKLIIGADGMRAPEVGPAIPAFGMFVGLCILTGFVRMIRKYLRAVGIEKIQWRFLLAGLSLTFLLVLGFSFIYFIVTGNLSTVRFGHLYTLPFLIFTAYAMIKHHLLNLKAIVAELAVVLLNLILFMQLVNATSTEQFITALAVLIGALIVGVLLVRGVIKEIKHIEELQILTNQLEVANEQLKALDKARADFITIASHQLRTPPATIKWYLSSIIEGDYGQLDESVKDHLKRTMATNNSMIALIDDLLNVSRIERGKMEFMFEPTDILEITQVTVDQLIPQAQMKKVELVYEKPKEVMPQISADKEKLRQVINNLVDNAIKYTQKGKVVISVTKTAKDLMVKVTDTGKGIPPKQVKSIFNKYDRGESAARNSTGLGLGLYVAKVIIEQHKGKIWAESKGEGKGSVFIFTVPIKAKISKAVYDLTKDQKSGKVTA